MEIALVIGVAFVLLGLALLVSAGVVFFRQRKERATALRASGVVVDLARSQGQRGYLYHPVVEFETASGRKARFQEELGRSPAGYKAGQEVKVLYQPDNPEKAEIDSGSSLYFFPGCLLAMGAAFTLLGACLAAVMALVLLGPSSG